MKDFGVNIFDPEDPFYTDFCLSFQEQSADNSTGIDISMDTKRNEYFANYTVHCNNIVRNDNTTTTLLRRDLKMDLRQKIHNVNFTNGTNNVQCSFVDIDIDNYAKCECNSTNVGEINHDLTESIVTAVLGVNLEILTCPYFSFVVFPIGENRGFIVWLSLFLLGVIVITIQGFCYCDNNKYLQDNMNNFFRTDGCTFNNPLFPHKTGAPPKDASSKKEESKINNKLQSQTSIYSTQAKYIENRRCRSFRLG